MSLFTLIEKSKLGYLCKNPSGWRLSRFSGQGVSISTSGAQDVDDEARDSKQRSNSRMSGKKSEKNRFLWEQGWTGACPLLRQHDLNLWRLGSQVQGLFLLKPIIEAINMTKKLSLVRNKYKRRKGFLTWTQMVLVALVKTLLVI